MMWNIRQKIALFLHRVYLQKENSTGEDTRLSFQILLVS